MEFGLNRNCNDEMVVKQILGHNDVGLTLKVYAKLATSEVEYSYRKLVS